MSAVSSCPICLERYSRNFVVPLSLVPCGHSTCQPCWNILAHQHRQRHLCPICRTHVTSQVVNRDFLDLLDAEPTASTVSPAPEFISGPPPSAPPQPAYSPSFMQEGGSTSGSGAATSGLDVLYTDNKRVDREVLRDRCQGAFYVLDNSGSMNNEDGKYFAAQSDGTIRKIDYISRWKELASKTLQIAEYNIARGMRASYYLLNPRHSGSFTGASWVEDEDYVFIDPQQEWACRTQLELLKNRILDPRNVRGSTPLHTITAYFTQLLNEYARSTQYQHVPLCYNVITDGEPDDKYSFEQSLRMLVSRHHVFLTINLCTDQSSIVEYYNDLDQKLGSELSGMDVIDDMEAEQLEIRNAGNVFFVYTLEMHTARMAGCYSILADMLDEQRLPLHLVTKMCKELTGNSENMPHWSQRNEYLSWLRTHNRKVYDLYHRDFRDLLDVNKVDWALWHAQSDQNWQLFMKRHGSLIKKIFFVFVIFLLVLLSYRDS
eukprot:Colp12_sorted_trinity150504_noHs@23539